MSGGGGVVDIGPGVCGERVGVLVVCRGVSGGRGVGKGCCLEGDV